MKLSSLRFRRWFLVLLCVAVTGVFIAELMDIQIINAHEHRRLLEAHDVRTQTIRAVRGEIVDRNMRPITVNRMGYDVILDGAWLFWLPDAAQNEVILNLIELCERLGVEWIDNLPISQSQPYYTLPESGPAMDRLRGHLSLQPYATAQDAMFQLVNRHGLEEFPPHRQRQIAGVRYEMEQRGFSLSVPYVFASDAPREAAINIRSHSHLLPGVDIMESAIRHHVDGRLAPHIIGHVGPIYREELEAMMDLDYAMDDIIGKAGVEQAFEPVLRGINGQRAIHLERRSVIMAVESEPPRPGNTVVLTLDIDMQNVLQRALRDQIYHLQETARPGEGREADSGAAAVINVRTGEILALATYPSYDLSTYRQDFAYLAAQTTLTPLVNRALHGEYAPGSVFKPVVYLAGVQAGIITPYTSFPCRRHFPVGTHVFTCMGYHGHISLNRAMAVSCNIYFYEIGRRVGIDAIDHVAYMLGLGVPTGIEIPEREGRRSNPETKLEIMDEQWFEGDLIQTSIGQLLHGYTPLQLANYAATIANRGRRMELTIVYEIRDYSQQNVVQEFEPRIASEMTDIPPESFEALVDSMVAASRPGGTAAMVFGWYPIDVASKTGTPETAGLPNSAFIAFAPAQEPEIAIAIIIERGWHGFTSAPVARAVFDYHFGFTPPTPPAAEPEPELEYEDEQPDDGQTGPSPAYIQLSAAG